MKLRQIAFLISALLHPLLLPTLAFAWLFYLSPFGLHDLPYEAKKYILINIFLLTFLLPTVSMLIIYLLGGIRNLTLDNAQDRHLPFLITTAFYTLTTYLFTQQTYLERFPLIILIIGSISLSIALVTIITFFWKISAHSTGISGVVGFMLGLIFKQGDSVLLYPTLFCIVLAGLLMSARLYLNAHTPSQILGGMLLGFGLCFGSIIFLL